MYGKNRAINTGTKEYQPDNIYVDTLKHNNNEAPILAKFSETKSQPYLDGPIQQYFLTISTAYIPASSIPLFRFLDNTYSITMSYNGVDVREFVQYIDYNAPIMEQFVFTYYEFINMINQTFITAFNTLSLNAGPLPVSTAPKMYLLEGNQGFAISFDQEYSEDVIPNTVKVYFNNRLYAFFENFWGSFLSYNDLNGKDFLFIVENQINNIDTTNNKFINRQAYEAFYLLIDARSIVITTQGLPIQPEFITTSQDISNSGNLQIPVLTTFTPDWASFSSNKESIVYSPTPQYRLCDMLESSSNLYKIDYQMFWQDRFGILYPIMIPPNDHISMKFLFIRKDAKAI